MKYPRNLIPAQFLYRKSRFSAVVSLDGREEYVHVPNSGRLREILVPGREVFILPSGDVGSIARKTAYTLVLSRLGDNFVSIEAAKANDLFSEALAEGKLDSFAGYGVAAREKRLGLSRIDFLLRDSADSEVFTEVKSVSLVEDGVAKFPDAVTLRGLKHLNELIKHREKGFPVAVVFVIQRSDAVSFSPNDTEDPKFGEALRLAFSCGVQIYAYRCHIDLENNYITDPVPIELERTSPL